MTAFIIRYGTLLCSCANSGWRRDESGRREASNMKSGDESRGQFSLAETAIDLAGLGAALWGEGMFLSGPARSKLGICEQNGSSTAGKKGLAVRQELHHVLSILRFTNLNGIPGKVSKNFRPYK